MIIELVGWLGGILLILAYYFLSTGKLRSNDPGYNAANWLGSVCLMINALSHGAVPAGVLNALFAIIAAWSIWHWRK